MENKFYAVRSKDGKYFKSKGYGGYGNSWRDNLNEAKIYPKPGPARAQITFWATNYPEYGVPDLVEFVIRPEDIRVVDEVGRLDKLAERREKKKERVKIENIKWRAYNWWGQRNSREQQSLIKNWVSQKGTNSDGVFTPENITMNTIIEMWKFYTPDWESKYKK